MAILDQRVVMVVFGDNANLSASVAKTIGTLLLPAIKDRPEIDEHPARRSRRSSTTSRPATARLYDAKAGLFYFGWDATRDRLFGWEDLQGKWTTGHMDYLVNEFRGPATFVVAPVRPSPRRDQEPRLQDEALPDAGRARPVRAGPLGGLGVPGHGTGRLAWRARSAELADAAGERGRDRGRLRHAEPAPRLPLRVVHGRRAPSTRAASASPRSPSHRGRGSPTPPRSIPWVRPTRSHPRRSSSSWAPTGPSSRSCSPTTARGKGTTSPGTR